MSNLCKIILIEDIRDRVIEEIKSKTSNQNKVSHLERVTYNNSLDIVNKILDKVMVEETSYKDCINKESKEER